MHVVEDGQGLLEDNDIVGNTFSGVAIASGGNPILLRVVNGPWPFPPNYQLAPQPLAALDLPKTPIRL